VDGALVTVDIAPAARPPYGSAAIAAGAAFVLYAVTLAPTTAFWDTSEYIATAHIVGIPHPPGNPLFVVLGRVWSLLLAPLGLPVAVRINLLAATTSAAATGCLYLIAHRVLGAIFDKDRFARIGAGASALVGATAFTVWNQSTVNEKVYTVSVLIIALVSWLVIRWGDRRDEPGSERLLLWAFFLLALGSTNHLMSVLPAPAILVFVALRGLKRLLRPAFLARVLALGVLGLSFNYVLPTRAALGPVINEGEPVCESLVGATAAIYSNGQAGCPALADNLTRRQYRPPPVTERKAPFAAQLTMYWQYFEWQWSRGLDPSELLGTARLPFALLFLALGGAGLWAAWRADRSIFAYLAVLAVTLTVGLVIYLNFRYGYSLAPEIADRAQHEVRERDYFFVAGFLLWGSLAGTGLAWGWHTVAGMLGEERRYVAFAPVLLLAVMPLTLNWAWASRSGDYAARDWAYDLLISVEPYGVLFTNGDNDTFPLWYLQEVEGIRPDVTVIVGQYLYTTWYPTQLKHLTQPVNQRVFDPNVVPGLYPDRPPPERSITALTDEQMDQVGTAQLANDLTIGFPGIAVTYPAEMILDRAQQLAISIIHDSIDERPVFFAATGGILSDLVLERWGVRHGLATKLEFRSLDADQPERLVRGSPEYGASWFDVDHSLRLQEEVYLYRGIRGRRIWQDRSTLNIPWQYYATTLMLADAAEVAGRSPELVSRLQADAVDFQIVAEGGLFGTPAPPVAETP
jgi:hypothetical protein